jgi:hypothetical protein
MTFMKGETVEFQNHHHAWTRGTVMALEEEKIHVKFFDSFARSERVIILPPKRVRAVE